MRDIDLDFIDMFMMRHDFIMDPIPHINFPGRTEGDNIVRFIPNENLIRINEEESRRASKQDQSLMRKY
jgi:hypothetical protein